MAVFPCAFFTTSTKYPQSGIRVQLGRSYQFDAPPEAPDQRLFSLSLQGMFYFVTSGGAIDLVTSPNRNLAVLEAFYNLHKRALEFTFNHPVYGNTQCKFNSPLEIPEGAIGGNGYVEGITVELIEIP